MSLVVYLVVFVVLIGSTAFELTIIGLPLPSLVMTSTILGLAGVKAILIALFFQHLKDEPKALSTVPMLALIAAVVLIGISLLGMMGMKM